MADLNKLIENIHNYQRDSDINEFKSELLKNFLYFFVIDDGSFKSVTELIWTSKDRPVQIPMISKEDQTFGVLYTTKKVALESKEDRFILASMKGPEALKLMRGIKEITQIIIQGKDTFIYLNNSTIDEILKNA